MHTCNVNSWITRLFQSSNRWLVGLIVGFIDSRINRWSLYEILKSIVWLPCVGVNPDSWLKPMSYLIILSKIPLCPIVYYCSLTYPLYVYTWIGWRCFLFSQWTICYLRNQLRKYVLLLGGSSARPQIQTYNFPLHH